MLSFIEFQGATDEEIEEAVKRTKVIRGGARKIKFKSSRAGYKVVGKREVRINPVDAKKMSIRNTKSARKRKGRANISNMKRARSMNKRTGI
jgi:hypothetical protein